MTGIHWKQQGERASAWGIGFLTGVLRIAGPTVTRLMVVPVALFYTVTNVSARRSSRAYLDRLVSHCRKSGGNCSIPGGPGWWLSFRHILSFAWSFVDRVHSWMKPARSVEYEVEGQELLDSVLESETGAVFLVSHVGNFDLLIARSRLTPDVRFNIIMDTSHTRIYNRFRDQMFQSDGVRFIEPGSIDPVLAMELTQCVGRGEIVVIAADRTSGVDSGGNVTVRFLGDLARFPSGPYLLAHFLQVPVYCVCAVLERGLCRVQFTEFASRIHIPRGDRLAALQGYAGKFAEILEKQCMASPLQWYNFYDFWQPASRSQPDKS